MKLTATSPKPQPILLIHGGAWAMPDDAVAAHENGVRNALHAGWSVLSRGGSALDAVEAAITEMEEDDTFDAGRGSFLTRDGRVQLDALMMSGADLRAGGVACVERLRNPIQAARLVLERSPHVYFVGPGAESFAAGHGMGLIDNAELVIPRERERLERFQRAEAAGLPDTTFAGSAPSGAVIDRQYSGATDPVSRDMANSRQREHSAGAVPEADLGPTEIAVDEAIQHGLPNEWQIDDPTLHSHDTVGAVAFDGEGNLAAGTSTGGTLSKSPGRVGDSSLIGCGCYADNQSAAVSLTGWGEPIMKLVLGKWATDRVAAGSSPQQAAVDAIAYLHRRLGGHGGMILLGPDGRIGLAHNTPRMAWGWATAEGQKIGIDL
ncbi:MAG: isoaspartyl peptidase/L-asparaginase [Janthinobacterium lividum]